MDESVVNMFKDATVGIDNPQSKEEDEEIEEQKRLQEELEDLLTDGIHPFRYDDSTINSSTNTSAASYDGSDYNRKNYQINNNQTEGVIKNLEDEYRNADSNNQLKILYDIRMREINILKEEFQQYQTEKTSEIKILKNKVTLGEAEMRHLQITVTNLENLLVDKTDSIKQFNQQISEKDNKIESLENTIEKLNIEIYAYNTTINDLQLKLIDNNPFSAGMKALNSEEMHKSHEQQINRLEGLLDEQSKKSEILANEKIRLEEELKRFVDEQKKNDDENNLTIMELSKKLTNTQQQCKDLYVLGEAIKKESDHFKERLKQLDDNNEALIEDNSTLPHDYDTLKNHVETFKRMLLDKDIELKTLIAKQKFYENDMNELFEYRELLDSLQNISIRKCDVAEHGKQLVIMQKQLNEYQMVLEDRNREIMDLHAAKKEYSEKIEEMLRETRNDLQNLSTRYSLPQLEQMTNDLKLAEETINNLKDELNEQITKINQLKLELQQTHEKLNEESNANQRKAINLTELQNNLKQREDDVRSLQNQLDDFKKSDGLLRVDNEKLQKQLEGTLNNLKKSQDELITCQQFLKTVEETKTTLEQQLLKTQQQLNDAKLECLELKKNCNEIHNETITKSIVEELEYVENQINQNDQIQIDIKQDIFQKILQAELLKSELLLRQQLQNDNLKKNEDIEKRYKNLLQQKSDLFHQEIEKLKKQEDAYRKQLALVLSQCSGKIIELEKENCILKEQIKTIANEYQNYQCKIVEQVENYKKMLDEWKSGVEIVNKTWEKTVAIRTAKYIDVQKNCNKLLKNITTKLEKSQNDVDLVERLYNERINALKLKI